VEPRFPDHERPATVRTLATTAFFFMALGALLLQYCIWERDFHLPETWIRAMEEFYRIENGNV
jgi:hypothetical protein